MEYLLSLIQLEKAKVVNQNKKTCEQTINRLPTK